MLHNTEPENFDSFKYLGSFVYKDSAVEQRVKGRIAAGNKVFCANKKIIFSKVIKKEVLKSAAMKVC
jgi:hypothetical protein